MAIVPRVERRVTTSQLPGVHTTAAETEASAGVGVAQAKGMQGRALVGLGQDIGELGSGISKIVIQERQKADETALLESDNKAALLENQLLYDPEKGALSRRGKDAAGLPEEVGAAYEKGLDEIQQTLQPGAQQQAFAKVRARRSANMDLTLRRHMLGEMQRFEGQELQASVELAKNAAIQNAEDPRRVGEELSKAADAIRLHGPRLGLGPQELEKQVADLHSDVYVGVIDGLLSQDKTAAARAYFEETKDQISGAALARVQKAVEAGTLRSRAQDETDRILKAAPTSLTDQRELAKKIDDRQVRDETLQRLEHEQAVRDRLENDERKQWNVQARQVLDQTGDWRKLETLPFWSKLDTQEVGALRAYAEHRTKKIPVETDQAVYYSLITKATSSDPAVRAEFFDPKKTNMLALSNKLSSSDWEMFTKMQTVGAAELTRDQHALLVNQANQNRIVDEAIVAMGHDPSPQNDPANKNFDAAKIAFVNDFRREVRERVAALEASRADKGKLAVATDDEVQTIVDRMRVPIGQKMIKDNWGPLNTYGDVYAWQPKTFEEIPLETREAIKRALYATGQVVSKDAVLELYRQRLSGIGATRK